MTRNEFGQLTDGTHVFFPCSWTTRTRWAVAHWPDDGSSIPTHGAEDTLEAAKAAADKRHAEREAAK
jgi:hypothetical protein